MESAGSVPDTLRNVLHRPTHSVEDNTPMKQCERESESEQALPVFPLSHTDTRTSCLFPHPHTEPLASRWLDFFPKPSLLLQRLRRICQRCDIRLATYRQRPDQERRAPRGLAVRRPPALAIATVFGPMSNPGSPARSFSRSSSANSNLCASRSPISTVFCAARLCWPAKPRRR